ncbi:MAG: hypothetical protein AB7S96_05760 [Candidatus Izemoplasmatales bacterium]
MFENRSKIAFLSILLALAYCIYFFVSYKEVLNQDNQDQNIILDLLFILALPHIGSVILALFLDVLGFLQKNHQLLLVSSIFFLIGSVLFILYAMFVFPVAIVTFIGYRKQKALDQIPSL